MSKINTNMAGVTTLYHLRNKEEGLNKALERISSGLRLNHAVDDAAGASIVNRMTSQIKGLEAAIRNAADAISLTQTAEGAIEEVTQILHRMRELSVQSANGVYTGQDRQAIQNEVGALQEELHRIAESSTFNGVKMLNGDFLDTTFQVGFNPNDTATLSIEDVKPTGLGEYVLSTSNTNAENYLQEESTPVAAGTTDNHIASEGTTVSLRLAEASSLSVYTINQSVNGNAITGLGSASLKSFVDADTGSTGAFSIETADGQVTNVDSSRFQIDAGTGQITLAAGSTGLDFEAAASASGNNTYNFKVVYTNSDGVQFKENVSLSLTNNLNVSGASTVAVKTNTADNTPDATLDIGQLSTDMLLQAKRFGMAETNGAIDATDFTGRFRVQSNLQGVLLDNSTGELTFKTANNLSNTTRLLTTDNQSVTVELLDGDNNIIYTEVVTLDVSDASVEDAISDGFTISSPGVIAARTNQTDATITTNTEVGTPTRIIEESALLPEGVTAASLGFDSDTEFSLASTGLGAADGVTIRNNGNGTFDVDIETAANLTNPSAGNQTIVIEATDTSDDVLTKGAQAVATATTATSSLTIITGESGRADFFISSSDLTDKAAATDFANASASSKNKFVQIKGPGGAAKPSWITIGASAAADTNTISSSTTGTAEVVSITGLATATSASTYSITIDGQEITTAELTATSAGDLVAAFNTALSAASVDITVSSTSATGLTLTFDDTGSRDNIDSTIDFSASKTTGFSAGTASTTVEGSGSGFEFALEIDKDASGNIPVGQQSVEIEYVEVTSGVEEVITVSGFTGATSAVTYQITIDGTTYQTSSTLTNATGGAVAANLDAVLSAAGVAVDVSSGSAGEIVFTFEEGDRVNQHTSLNLSTTTASSVVVGTAATTVEGVSSANNVVFTETLSIDSKPFNQHTFNVNLTVNEGEGQGVTNAGLSVTSRTTNDNAIPSNVIDGGPAVTTVSAVSEVITISGFTAASSAATYTVTIGGSNFTTASTLPANASAGAIATALDTALSAANVTVAATATGDLTFTFDTGGARTDEASTINFRTTPTSGFDDGTATVTTQGVDSYRAGTSNVDIQTNAPVGTAPFTFGVTDLTSPLGLSGAVTTVMGNVGFELADGAPDGVRITDNNNGTFTAFIDVDSGGTFLPADATSFRINIIDDNGTYHQETINLRTVTDIKGNVTRTAVGEPEVGQIDHALTAVESARIKVSQSQMSSAMRSFITDNAGGTFSITGADADLFRIDEQTGLLSSKNFVDFENAGDAGANNIYDVSVVYTSGANSFKDNVSLTVTNSTEDDVVTQAAGRPLVGRNAIEAASLISEEEDFTIYGNVGTATIDVNGGSSAYEIVSAVNGRQGETGVYANAITRVNVSFPDQFDPLDDAVSFMLKGVNDEPVLVSGSVEFGIVNGRDANVRGLADAINGVSGKTGITAKVSINGAELHLISNEGHDILVEDFEMSVLSIPMNISAANDELESVGDVQQLFKGSTETDTFRSTGQITFHSPYVFSIEADRTGIDGGGLFQLTPGAAKLSSVASLDVLTVENAKKMLTAVDGALVRIDLERSDLGATMSRMEHTINNLSNVVVNTKAARSRIQDADIAEETTEMTKAQVLAQAAQAMLAQANRTSQGILSLLQG